MYDFHKFVFFYKSTWMICIPHLFWLDTINISSSTVLLLLLLPLPLLLLFCLRQPPSSHCLSSVRRHALITITSPSQLFQGESDKYDTRIVQILISPPIFIIVWVKKYFLAFPCPNLTIPHLNTLTPSTPEHPSLHIDFTQTMIFSLFFN